MRRTAAALAVTSALAAGAVVGGGVSAPAGAAPAVTPHAVRDCSAPRVGEAACTAQRWVPATGDVDALTIASGTVRITHPGRRTRLTGRPAAIFGKSPSDIQSAYKLSGLSAGGRTVAIVDAYGYPNAERDLGVYRAQFGLPACTKGNGCLTIVNQDGGSTPPASNVGWAGEQALDLDAVSAACPSCRILLVQAASASFADLGLAVNTAAKRPGVAAISNSYGGSDAADATYGKFYNHPGIAVTASTGDAGFKGASYPASSHYVTAVGGTTLSVAAGSSRGWSESAWKGAGSGCSTLNLAPAGQLKAVTGCSGRAMADVAADADPSSGLAVYGPAGTSTSSWAQVGGTSLSAPIVASVYVLSGRTSGYANTFPYGAPSGLFDVTAGSNGSCATFCTAKAGYDGPTGLGTPNGTSAF